MSDLIEFLLARIAEDEATALAAAGGDERMRGWAYEPYSASSNANGEVYVPDTRSEIRYPGGGVSVDYALVTCDSEGLSPAVDECVGPHIARHDPARVLAECKAKRLIVAYHSRRTAAYCSPLDEFGPECSGCREGCSYCEGEHPWPCTTLHLLALPYADHPDFREEWRV